MMSSCDELPANTQSPRNGLTRGGENRRRVGMKIKPRVSRRFNFKVSRNLQMKLIHHEPETRREVNDGTNFATLIVSKAERSEGQLSPTRRNWRLKR
jgi:hypothetical protein